MSIYPRKKSIDGCTRLVSSLWPLLPPLLRALTPAFSDPADFQTDPETSLRPLPSHSTTFGTSSSSMKMWAVFVFSTPQECLSALFTPLRMALRNYLEPFVQPFVQPFVRSEDNDSVREESSDHHSSEDSWRTFEVLVFVFDFVEC